MAGRKLSGQTGRWVCLPEHWPTGQRAPGPPPRPIRWEGGWGALSDEGAGWCTGYLHWRACHCAGLRPGWLAGWLPGCRAGWLALCLACCRAGWLVAWLTGCLADDLACCLPGWLAEWLAAGLAGWLACCLGGWLITLQWQLLLCLAAS